MSQSFDAIIIGAGIVGTSIAFALSKAGLKTLNLDALPTAGYGSTSHSSAIVRPLYSHAGAAALAHEARARWLTWGEHLGAKSDEPLARYTECGMTALLYEGGDDFAPGLRAMAEAGVEFEIWDLANLKEKMPSIEAASYGPPKRIDEASFGVASKGGLIGALHVPAAGYVNDPQLAAQNLMRAATAKGASFRFNAKVVAVICKGHIAGARLADGTTISTPILVNAAGPHSSKINKLAGLGDALHLTTRAMRHEVAYLRRPALLDKFTVTMDADTGVYMRPDGADLLIGSLDPECDTPDYVDPDDFNDAFTDQWTNQAWRAGLRFPKLEISNQARGTVGLYDVTEDWIPIYDRSDLGGYYMAIGTSGNQFKNAPMIGDLMARIILGCEGGHDHDGDPLTLHLAQVNRTIDLAHYSRLRDVRETSNVLA